MTDSKNVEDDDDLDMETNLLTLGKDAWDDTAIIESFDDNIKYFAKQHSNYITDMSKVPSMISNLNLNIDKNKYVTVYYYMFIHIVSSHLNIYIYIYINVQCIYTIFVIDIIN